MNQGIDALVNHLGTLFERRREKRQATIIGVERSEQSGRQGYVLAEIQRAENDSYVQRIFVGDASNFAVGDVKWVRGSGNPVDPDWQFGESIKSRNPVAGADVDKPIQVLTIPTEENPDDGFANPVGVVTEEDQDSTTGAGVEQAQARIYYRTIVPGSYSVYDPSTYITGISLHYRRVTDENWRYTPSHDVWPRYPKRLYLVSGIDDNDLAATVADSDDTPGDDWPVGHYVYWQIDGEVLLAKVSGVGAMTILERGVEGSTAVSHATNAAILLLTGMAVLANLDPGVNHEVRIVAVQGNGLIGPPSVAVAFYTWARSSVPALTTDQFNVEMLSNGFHLEWERPEVSPGVPMTARLRYRLYRNTGGALPGAQIVDEGHAGFAADIAATLWNDDGTRNIAYWFGIEPYDSFGNAGAILWKQDDEPPFAPDVEDVFLTPVPGGIQVDITSAETLQLDRGFKEFVLYRNTIADDSGAAIVHRWIGRTTIYALDDLGAYYYQVSSADWAGNVDVDNLGNGAYWQYMRALYVGSLPDLQFPANGNFDSIDPKASPVWPLYWVYPADVTGAGVTVTLNPTGGAYGTKRMDIVLPAGGGVSHFADLYSAPFPYNSQRNMAIWFLHKESGAGGTAVGYAVSLLAYTTDDGTGTGTPIVVLGANSFVPATSWAPAGNTINSDDANAVYKSARIVISISATIAGTRAGAVTVSIDNVYAEYEAPTF